MGRNDEGLGGLVTGENRMEWYYETDGQPQGPVSVEDFLDRVREGVIGEETLVWRKGMVDWMEYSTVADAPRAEIAPSVSVEPPALPVGVEIDGVDTEGRVHADGDGPSWERDAASLNLFARLGSTCAEVMMDTERCFRSLRRRGNLGAAIAYSVIAQVIGLIFFSAELWVGIRNRGLELVLRDLLPRQVEVDTELGHVKLTKYVAVHDCGRIMNPLTATSQILGAAVMGVGMALHENLVYDQKSGQPLSAGFYYDRIPTHMDAPTVEVSFIEDDDGYGPYGAKSIGESGIILSPGAINNAIFNAIGRRLKDLPITRDKILGALA